MTYQATKGQSSTGAYGRASWVGALTLPVMAASLPYVSTWPQSYNSTFELRQNFGQSLNNSASHQPPQVTWMRTEILDFLSHHPDLPIVEVSKLRTLMLKEIPTAVVSFHRTSLDDSDHLVIDGWAPHLSVEDVTAAETRIFNAIESDTNLRAALKHVILTVS
jgi:hypothetical protein